MFNFKLWNILKKKKIIRKYDKGETNIVIIGTDGVIILDNIIKKITEIDRKAISIKQNTEKIVKENEAKLKETLKEIEIKEIRKAEKKGDDEYNTIIEDAEKIVERINMKGNKEIARLEAVFEDKHQRLCTQIFDKIINNY